MTEKAEKTPITCARDVVVTVRPVFKKWHWEQECFVVLLLDTKNRVIGKPEVTAVGTVNSVQVHPRDVFRAALRKNAVAVIVAHCHPSGDVNPSQDDMALTKRLREAGNVLGVPLLDHVVVSQDNQYSFSDHGRL